MNGHGLYQAAPDAVRPITIGILLDGRIQERWVLECVRQALTVPRVRLTALALADPSPRQSFAVRLHSLFDRLDERLRCRGEQLLALTDVATELALPPLQLGVARQDERWRLNDAGIDTLRGCEVDLWLCFAAVPPHRLPRSVSRLGAWGVEIGHGLSGTNAWAGAMEVGMGSPVTMVSVVDYATDGDGLLYRSFGATAGNSPRRNRLRAVRKAVNFFRRLLECLMRGRDILCSARPATLSVPARYPALPTPTVPALTRLSWRLASNWIAHRLPSKRALGQWQVAYYFSDEAESGCRFERLRYLVPPEDRFWADPFAVEYQGRYFIFFEEMPYRTGKGHLMAMEVFDNAEPGVDNTDELHLYGSSTPFGPWAAHPDNPVISDVRCARPAGPLFLRDRILFRPSQDCSLGYGHSVLINRVQVLSEDAYKETAVDRIAPRWRRDVQRVHTVGGNKRLRVIDCMTRR